MLPPVRCFTCGKPIGGKIYQEFTRRVQRGEDPKKVLDDLGLKRYCCRTVLLSTVVLIDDVAAYNTIKLP